SIEGSTAGHIAARLMQPDTAMAHITAIALRTIPATTRRAAVLEAIPYAPTRLPIPHPATAITCHPLRPYSPTIPECLEPRTARTGPAQSAMHTACTSAATWCAQICQRCYEPIPWAPVSGLGALALATPSSPHCLTNWQEDAMSIVRLVQIKTNPLNSETAERILKDIASLMISQKGCMSEKLLRVNSGEFIFYSEWETTEDMEHFTSSAAHKQLA